MSRVLSLSLADKLYAGATKHADGQGLTVYQYVRQAIETQVSTDDCIWGCYNGVDDEPDE